MIGAGPRRRGLAGDTWAALVAALAALTVTPVGLPAILADLPTSLAGSLWVIGAGVAATAAGLAAAPLLCRRLGTVRVLWAAEIGLAATACLCAAAAAPAQLIAARAAQGLAAGLVAATALAVLAASTRRRRLVVGVAAAVVVAAVAGVVIGAFAVTAPGWRAGFAIQAVAAAAPALSIAPRSRRQGSMPPPGVSAALAGGLLLLALPLQAAATAAYASIETGVEAGQNPPPGRLVEVGGHRLHLWCQGRGSPTVVLEADLGEWSLDWSAVQPDLSAHSRVCSYDRAGLGWSDSAGRPRTAAAQVEELRTLLDRAGERGPFVAAGHGYGGMVVRLWAALHPAEVAGMVLVDAADPELLEPPHALLGGDDAVTRLSLCALWSPLGLSLIALQVDSDGYTSGYPPTVADRLVATVHRQGLCAARRDEALDAGAAGAELGAADHGLGSIPLVVLRHQPGEVFSGPGADAEEAAWQAVQARLARLSSAGRLEVAAGSGHAIMLDRPDLVVGALGGVIDAVRASTQTR